MPHCRADLSQYALALTKLKDKMLSGDLKHCNADLSDCEVVNNIYNDIFKVLDSVSFFHGLFNDFSRKLPGLV